DTTTPLGLYAVAKQLTESLTDTLREQHDFQLTTVRFGSVYGLGERSRGTRPRVSKVGQFVHEAMHSGQIVLYTPDAQDDWTLASDIGEVIHLMLSADTWQHPLYNVASGEVLQDQQIAEAIRDVLPEVAIVHDSVGEASHDRDGYLVSQRLQNEFGFDAWTPFADGIKDVINETRVELGI
ncbi:MAG: NAD(P)-dependent oxidoreductase, partial [Chloroflexota bacterium]